MNFFAPSFTRHDIVVSSNDPFKIDYPNFHCSSPHVLSNCCLFSDLSCCFFRMISFMLSLTPSSFSASWIFIITFKQKLKTGSSLADSVLPKLIIIWTGCFAVNKRTTAIGSLTFLLIAGISAKYFVSLLMTAFGASFFSAQFRDITFARLRFWEIILFNECESLWFYCMKRILGGIASLWSGYYQC